MRKPFPVLGAVAFAVVLAFASTARAAIITIDVAEFRWTVDGSDCVETSPGDCLSSFSLTYLWNGPIPFPVVSGAVDVDGSPFGTFFPLDASLPFDQLSIGGVPTSAQATIGFTFAGPQSLTSPLLVSSSAGLFETSGSPSATGLFHLFQFDYDDNTPTAVPEPATIGLLSLGLLAARRQLRARR